MKLTKLKLRELVKNELLKEQGVADEDAKAALKIKKDQLEVKTENLYIDENILRLAKKYINRYSVQASPKGSIYIGEKNWPNYIEDISND